MRTKTLRSWVKSCKSDFFFMFTLNLCLRFDPMEHGPGWGRLVIFWGILFGYMALLGILLRLGARAIDRTILRSVAWDNKAALNPVFTVIPIYGIWIALSLPPLWILAFTGVIPKADWNHTLASQLILDGGMVAWFRVLTWFTMPV